MSCSWQIDQAMAVDELQEHRQVGECMGCQHVRKHVSERDLNPHGCDLRRCTPAHAGKRVIAGQRVVCVSEDRALPIAHPGDITLTTAFVPGGAR
jgi:hypothetical protein